MRYLVIGSIVALLGAAACGGGDDNSPPTTPTPNPNPNPPVGSTVVNIPPGAQNLGSAAFGSPVTVRNGSTVTWSNEDSLVHNIAADGGLFNSGALAPDRNFNFTFTTNGTFPYHCNIHPVMRGSITVQP
jgi:plastocyanin